MNWKGNQLTTNCNGGNGSGPFPGAYGVCPTGPIAQNYSAPRGYSETVRAVNGKLMWVYRAYMAGLEGPTSNPEIGMYRVGQQIEILSPFKTTISPSQWPELVPAQAPTWLPSTGPRWSPDPLSNPILQPAAEPVAPPVRGPRPGRRTNPATRTNPFRSPTEQTQVGPGRQHPGSVSPVPPPSDRTSQVSSPRQPPGPGKKERKMKVAVNNSSFGGRLIGGLGELADAVNAMHDALPKELQLKYATIPEKALQVYRHINEVDLNEAVMNMLANQGEDRFIGKTGQDTAVLNDRLGNPGGVTLGPAL